MSFLATPSYKCITYGFLIVLWGGINLFAQVHIAEPNWSRPHFHPEAAAERDRVRQSTLASQRIEFTFSLPAFERTTSAAVYDKSGTKIRTLWMDRTYDQGEHEDTWDGKDDHGQMMPPEIYTIKIGANNVSYTWEGLIGNTEYSWTSYRTWDGIVPSFIRSLAFVDGKAYSANGYNEGGYAGAVFDEASPNGPVAPLTKLIFSTLQHFMFASTDGNLIYFGFQTYSDQRYPDQGVIAFYPSGELYRFPRGSPYPSFPQNTATFWNDATVPPTGIPNVKAVDISPYPSAAVTGVAVQRNGRLLATAHGYYRPDGSSGKAVSTADEIRLWDKITGAPLGKISIPNPQAIEFDLENDLWVISGYGKNDKLYRIADVGAHNLVNNPISGLSNPMSISISPRTGSLFIADGGISQEVKEFDPKTGRAVSTLGTAGGYLSKGSCDASVSNTTFWFDPGYVDDAVRVVGTSSPFVSWVSVSETGDLWIGDFSTSRILHFARAGGGWKYVDRIMYMPWAYDSSVPAASPTRVFGGPNGFLEFRVDYAVPLSAGDPEANGGNHSWDLVRNWLPCYVQKYHPVQMPNQMLAFSFPNGSVIGRLYSYDHPRIPALIKLNVSGEAQVKVLDKALPQGVTFDADGSYYLPSLQNNGSKQTVSFKKFAISSYDAEGFPNWFQVGTDIGGFAADHSFGDPIPHDQPFTYWPSSNGIVPIFDVEKNFDLSTKANIAFHLGGLHLNGDRLLWETMPERDILFTDGEGSFPSADVRNRAHMGAIAWAQDDNIFALQNGNGGPWSCQLYHFKDNGLFVGQFGFQTSPDYPATNISWQVTGFPQKGTEQPLAPGECSDENYATSVRVGNDYYLYVGDEGYHKGIHRWRVSNLQSYIELVGAAKLGGAVRLTDRQN